MSSSGSENVQARVLLQTLCNCMVSLLQTAPRPTVDPNSTQFGIKADHFGIELEKFISSVISRSQQRNQDITIEATLGKDSFYHPEENKAQMGSSSNDKSGPELHTPTNQSMTQAHSVPQAMPLSVNERDLGSKLQIVHKHVTEAMPIRLLCFKPQNSKLKISLFEREDVYNYLALKLRDDSNKKPTPIKQIWWRRWMIRNATYAILSHTWNQTLGELTYGDWQKGSLNATQPKCRKLVNFCKAAWENHGLTLGWIDTVCINKESSAELDESIRSMYAWYENAKVCITYLARSATIPDMHNDPWFTRGWTLQELVAPRTMTFYNKDWNQLSGAGYFGWDDSTQSEITLATTITASELENFHKISISRKMQLAAKRRVTRQEDRAYCLMGIFNISISTAYGEGAERAFFRVVEEIFRSTKDVSDIFNWAGAWRSDNDQSVTSLFPSHPSNYLYRSSNPQLRPWHPIEPLTLTHLGLRMPILLMPAVPRRGSVSPYPIGDYHAAVAIPVFKGQFAFRRSPHNKYFLLDKRTSGPESLQEIESYDWGSKVTSITMTFGTLNVEEQGANIRVPKTCLALLLKQDMEDSSQGYKRVYTKNSIVFDLKKTGSYSDSDSDEHYYEIERSQLETHGMKLVTLYL